MKNKIGLKNKKNHFFYIISGIAIGFLNGFFGGGGGMIVVPFLENVLKFDTKKSHATAIFIILPLCIISITTYIISGSFNFTNGGFVSLGVVLGGVIGAVLLKNINSNFIQYLFAILMIVAGVKIVI